MKCKKCGFELVDGQDICPRCGTSQTESEDSTGGVTMELPSMQTTDNSASGGKADKATDDKGEKVGEEVKKAAKNTAVKVKKGAKEAADKVKKAVKDATGDNADEQTDNEETANKGGGKVWLYALIGVVAAAVLVVIGYFVISYEPKGGQEDLSVLMAASEDTIYLMDGDKLVEIADVPEALGAREIITAADASSFYVIADAEYDEDSGENLGDLVYIKANGKQQDIDKDVVVGSLEVVDGLLWYEKADKDEKIVCCYDGRNAVEVIDEDNIGSWIGTDKVGKAYYTLIDEDDFTTEVFFIEKGDSESIMDEAQILALSSDYKKALLVSTDGEESTISIYDGKDDFEVMDDVQDVLVDRSNFDMLVISDAEDMILYYIPYGKEEIEIDDEVEEIVPLTAQSYSYSVDSLGDMIYYAKDSDLYAADFKGKNNDRILKNYEDIDAIDFNEKTKTLIYADDDEVVSLNLGNMKEESVELPDADNLRSYDVEIVGGWFVYRTEDNKEIFAYDGRREPVELSNDAEEITGFQSYMDKYVIWFNVDDELVLSELKEDSDEVIGDDVYTYYISKSDGIYFLSDYDDGEGDLYYIAKVGKEAERIEKDITTIFSLYYE